MTWWKTTSVGFGNVSVPFSDIMVAVALMLRTFYALLLLLDRVLVVAVDCLVFLPFLVVLVSAS